VLPPPVRICVQCGIDLKTGRALLTSKDVNQDELVEKADGWIRAVSFILRFGLFPIASEAFGTCKPLATRAITAVTVVASLLFLPVAWDLVQPSSTTYNLMQWSGSRQEAQKQYDETLARIKRAKGAAQSRMPQPVSARPPERDEQLAAALDQMEEMVQAEAREAFPPGVEFRWYQLFTAALLHGGIIHLASNLVFLLVFGLRVNELIGNLKMAVVYPLLAAIAGLAHHVAMAGGPMRPGLGASGAIMGLAGMYLFFFPRHKVHMVIWLRMPLLAGAHCYYKLFRMGGLWLLLLWVGLNDVLFVVLNLQDQTAHWAHIGGFVGGMVLALAFLLSRTVSARGGDLLSMILGRRAWALLGKPRAV
jgi:membrane associated rhomboid family serine protease